MKIKPKNPYQRLLDDIKAYVHKITYKHRVNLFFFAKEKLKDTGWNLNDVYERTAAAESLGYDVKLEAKPEGLQMVYVKKDPKPEWNWT